MRIRGNRRPKIFATRAAMLLGGLLVATTLLASAPLAAQAHAKSKQLAIYAIDVEGGQSTLLVSPTGASMLVDTGWADHNGRDAERIQAAMHEAGVSRIDYLLITHYHADHVGGLPNLVARVPVEQFYDHGPNREDSNSTRNGYAAYLKAVEGHPRHIVHPGEKIPVPGLNIVVLTADGKHISKVPGIKPVPNSYCAGEDQFPADPSENSRSAGILVRYGRFTFLDVGDLTDAKEIALVCPDNPIGHVDLYLAANHGMTGANARAFVFAIHPLVGIMNNGAHKGDTGEAWQTIHSSPGLEALWQLHTGEDPGDLNSPEEYIANTPGGGDGAYLKVLASSSGSFAVTNSRTGFTKDYSPR
jgi:competence protein ComEC